MGAWEKLLGFGGAALVLYGISSARKNSKARAEQEEKERKALAREEAKLRREVAEREAESQRRIAEWEAEIQRKKDMERKRINTPFCYPECISEDDFKTIAETSIKTMKRKFANFTVVDGKIFGTIISKSGISEWEFSIDFNDFGKDFYSNEIEFKNFIEEFRK